MSYFGKPLSMTMHVSPFYDIQFACKQNTITFELGKSFIRHETREVSSFVAKFIAKELLIRLFQSYITSNMGL